MCAKPAAPAKVTTASTTTSIDRTLSPETRWRCDDAVRRPASRTGLDVPAKPLRGRRSDEGFALLSNDFTYWSIVTRTELDKKTFRRAVERRKQVFEVNIELIRCVNEGETVVVEGHCDGVSADRTRYDSPFVCIFETRDGMIISLREYSDTQSLAEVYPVACATPGRC